MPAHYFNNLGFYETTLTFEQLQPVWDEVNEIQKDFDSATPFHSGLVGLIKKEYLLKKCQTHLENIVLPHIFDYHKEFAYPGNLSLTRGNHKLAIDYPWVNFMSRYESNPAHNHSGIMSFVIWLKIPYTMEQEHAYLSELDPNKNAAGAFSFVYTNSVGQIQQTFLPVDKTWENKLIVFPAAMTHAVHPFFSSDEYRISVAGNFILESC